MIELHRARPGEEGAAGALWERVFGDGDGLRARFFQLCAPFDHMMTLTEDGAVRSIVCVPEMTLRFPNGKTLKSGYMYALATDPGARGQGYGQAVMRYGEEFLKEQGADCAILVPAEPSLFRFFGGMGYAPAFSHVRRTYGRGELPARTEGRAVPAEAAEYNALRRRWLEGRFYAGCRDELVQFQKELSQDAGGDIYRLELPGGEGCAAAEPSEDGVLCRELLCAPEDVPLALALLGTRLPGERFTARLPVWTDPAGERMRWGAVRWLYEHPSPWFPGGEDGYLGLAFD